MADVEQEELYEAEWHAIRADVQRIGGAAAVMTATHSPVDLRDQWDRLRLDLEILNRKIKQLSASEYAVGHLAGEARS